MPQATPDDHTLAARLATQAGELLVGLRERAARDGGPTGRALGREGDRLAHELLVTALAEERPDDAVLSEEGAADPRRVGARRVWIVDPLDGTVNFVHHVPHVSVSIALWEDGAPLVGVVYDVARQEEFAAIRGRGATLNGELIRVTGVDSLSDAMILTGFPYDQREHPGAYLQQVERFLVESRAVRVIGSAALDLAWIAAGRADAYTEHGGTRGLKPWDMAAGSLLVTEAGGRFTDVDGRENVLEGRAFVASNGHLHERVASLVRETMPDHLR